MYPKHFFLPETTTEKLKEYLESWAETHHEVVEKIYELITSGMYITDNEKEIKYVLVNILDSQGHDGIVDLCIELTTKFEEKYFGYEWDGDYLEILWDFISDELYVSDDEKIEKENDDTE